MLRLSTIILSCCIVLNSCIEKGKNRMRMIFDETFNQSSSLIIYKGYLTVVDTTFRHDLSIDQVIKHVYGFKKDTFITAEVSTIKDIDLQHDIIIPNTGQYQMIGDTSSQNWSQLKAKEPDVYQLKDAGEFSVYLSRNNTGDCELHTYNKQKQSSSVVNIGNYTDYTPQMLIHDFNSDGVPEILVLTNFYLQNHYLVEVKAYKILN